MFLQGQWLALSPAENVRQLIGEVGNEANDCFLWMFTFPRLGYVFASHTLFRLAQCSFLSVTRPLTARQCNASTTLVACLRL